MLKTFQSRLILLFAAAGVLLVGIGVEMDRRARLFRDDAARVAESIAAADHVRRVVSGVRAAESAQRAFLLTGTDRDLGDHLVDLERVRREQTELLRFFRDTGRDTTAARGLVQRIDDRLAILAQTLDVRRRDGLEAATALVASGRGHEAMQAVEAAADAMLDVEARRYRDSEASTSQSAARMRTLLPIAIGVGLLLLGGAFGSTWVEQHRRTAAEARLEESAVELQRTLGEAHRMADDLRALSGFAELLQSCQSIEEAREGVRTTFGALLPRVGGRLALINASQNLVTIAAHWGDHALLAESVFTPDDCWALRRGQTHPPADATTGFVCRHVHHPNPDRPDARYICIPLAAQGEMLGVLTLDAHAPLDPAERQLAIAAADHLALALANLRLQQDLRIQSIRDPLTGLFNRRYLEASLERELVRAARRNQPLAVLMLDMDHFKRFNDTFGHEAGDRLLARFAELLQGKCRTEDIACRYGGEEFTAILLEADTETAQRRAEEIRAATAHLEMIQRGQRVGPLSVSIGVAVFPQHGRTPQELIGAADAALYRAKETGRNRVAVAA